MLIFETPAKMRTWSDDQRRNGRTIALVPTMGALHEGHLQLVDISSRRADVVVISIFVNRLQFNRSDDFERYPRRFDDDLARCGQRGVTAVYAPTQDSMYPVGFETHVEPGALSEPLEGAGRPGHFRGVATVVVKLFNAVRPNLAVFGRKDFQQLSIITRMVEDLDMGIEIIGVETVREHDGLAMSSRNQRLNPDQRGAAVVVPRSLDLVATAAGLRTSCSTDIGTGTGTGTGTTGDTGDTEMLSKLRRMAVTMIDAEPLAELEYFEIVDPTTLRRPVVAGGPLLALAAVWFGGVRLIDNRVVR